MSPAESICADHWSNRHRYPDASAKRTTSCLFIATYNRINASTHMVAGIHVQRNTKRTRSVEQEQGARWRKKHVRMSVVTPVV